MNTEVTNTSYAEPTSQSIPPAELADRVMKGAKARIYERGDEQMVQFVGPDGNELLSQARGSYKKRTSASSAASQFKKNKLRGHVMMLINSGDYLPQQSADVGAALPPVDLDTPKSQRAWQKLEQVASKAVAYERDPLSAIFADADEGQLADMVCSIQNGELREPIEYRVLDGKRVVVHGWQRLTASRELSRTDADIPAVDVTDKFSTEGDWLAYVYDKNRSRRHLNASQLAVTAVEYQEHLQQ